MSSPKATHSQALLEQALRSLPESESLGRCRNLIAQSIHEIALFHGKKEKQAIAIRQQWESKLKTTALAYPLSQAEQKTSLDALDKLIESEQKKIESLQAKKAAGEGGREQQMLLGG